MICKYCKKEMKSKSALRRHIKSHKSGKFYPCFCVDKKNGVYFCALTTSGPLAPIHVQKNILEQRIICTNDNCRSTFTALKNKHPGFECIHLRSIQECEMAENVLLDINIVEQFVKDGKINTNTMDEIKKMMDKAKQDGVPLVAYTDFNKLYHEDRMKYFSVYTGCEKYFSQLKRVRVSFDMQTKALSCKCKTTSKYDCMHEKIIRCLLVQKNLIDETARFVPFVCSILWLAIWSRIIYIFNID